MKPLPAPSAAPPIERVPQEAAEHRPSLVPSWVRGIGRWRAADPPYLSLRGGPLQMGSIHGPDASMPLPFFRQSS